MSRLLRVSVVLVVLAACGASEPSVPGDPSNPNEPSGLAAPEHVQLSPGPAWGNCVLSWQAPAVPVDAFEIQVSAQLWQLTDVPPNATIAGTRTSAEVDFGTWNPELSTASIAIRARRGALVSPYSASASCTLPVRPPEGLVAFVDSHTVDVRWSARSALVTSHQIERAELDAAQQPGAWVTLSGTSTLDDLGESVFEDTTASVGHAYGYRVTTIVDIANHSEPRETTTLVLGVPLQDSTIRLPKGLMVTDGRGHYGYVSSPTPGGVPNPVTRFTWGDGMTWTSVDVDGLAPGGVVVLYAPGLKLDAQGLPHVVYGRELGDGSTQIIHGSPNGARWVEDVIAVRGPGVGSVGAPSFDLDAAGNAMVVWIYNATIEAAIKSSTTWQVTSLASVYPDLSRLQSLTVFADHTGVIHLLLGDPTEVHHLTPRAGVWTRETVPTPAGRSLVPFTPLVGAGHDPDHLVVCSQAGSIEPVPFCVRTSPAGWGPVELLGVLPLTGAEWEWRSQIVLSPDGRRLALLAENRSGSVGHMFRSDDAGAWSETIVVPWQVWLPVFTSAGKLQIFSYQSPSPLPVTEADYLLQTEP